MLPPTDNNGITPIIGPLFGLDAVLADEDCERVELRNEQAGSAELFVRQGGDAWAPDDPAAELLHTRELSDLLRGRFALGADTLVCILPREQVTYSLERGAVRIERTPRAPDAADVAAGTAGLAAVTDALGIPKSKRKDKLRQAIQFAKIVESAIVGRESVLDRCSATVAREGRELRILDLACGRSYLGFVLVHLLGIRGCEVAQAGVRLCAQANTSLSAAHGYKVTLHGVDCDAALVAKCDAIAKTLGWRNATFELADLEGYAVAADSFDAVVSLHACDTLTDEAIRVACEARVPFVFAAPCCQHELRHQWKAHPVSWISRYSLLEQHLADALTDGFRCLVLEAMGYRVNVLRFAAPEVTPKNLLIQARLASEPRPDLARTALAFLKQFDVRPRLAALLNDPRLRA